MSRYQSISNHLSAIGLTSALLALGLACVTPVAAQSADSAPPPRNDDDKPSVQPTSEEPPQPVQREEGEDTEAAAEAQAEAQAASQAALESELASAKRFEAELDALLLPDGQLDTTREDALAKLNSLATRCGILANSAMHDQVKLVLLSYQARALAALASVEPADEELDRIEQLNDVAQQIAAIDRPGAIAAADYWLLLADMTQQAAGKQSPTKRQANIEQSLRAFIQAHQQQPEAAEYLIDARLTLAELLDQRGAQRSAAKQLNHIGELPEDSPRLAQAKRLRERIARLGMPISFESISTELMNWRSSDHLGKPVLIHVYADSVSPSVRMIDRISRRIVEGTLSGIAVVSLRVGDPVPGTSSPPWPTLPVQLERGGVLDQLGVTALPTLAWLDSEGRLAAIGTTANVLNQLDALRPDPDNTITEQAPDPPEQEPAPADPTDATDTVEPDDATDTEEDGPAD